LRAQRIILALLGVAGFGMWNEPALAGVVNNGPPKAHAPIPLEDRGGAISSMAKGGTYQATLSGSLIKQASATTSWFLYPGACNDRASGTWVPRTNAQADSLNSYAVDSQGGFGRADLTLDEKIIGVCDAARPADQRPAILDGSRMIWCGKYDPNWVVHVGYPNLTNQILYIDLESNRVPIASNAGIYTITMRMNSSTQLNYDYVYFIGGGDSDLIPENGGDEDPLGNIRAAFDQIRSTGSYGAATLQATFTGSILPTTPGLEPFVSGLFAPVIVGSGAAEPQTINLALHMMTENRALYVLITADGLFSSEDGLWPFGHGVMFDDIAVFDGTTTRILYDEQIAASGTDFTGGDILVADPVTGSNPEGIRICARVFPGLGELWAIQQGSTYITSDICNNEKNLTTDHFFLGVDPITRNARNGQFSSIVTCTFPVPPGTADITALWGEYLNLPRGSGYAQYAEYRYFKGGLWSNWENSSAGGGVRMSVINQWLVDGDQLASAVQADSLQVRYNLQCIPTFGADHESCDGSTQYAVIYDDLLLQVTTGVPAPVFSIFPGSVAQSTFVDGYMTGLNCTVTPCWPGIRGTDLQTNPNTDIASSAVKDNFNSPLGDSLTMSFVTGLRRNGMGINWHLGFDKSIGGGLTIARSNGAFNPLFDTPRAIYRLYDPATNSWSPWDSTSLDANNVSVSGDTVITDSAYRLNWPPRDKVGLNLPGGFTLNGQGAYNSLKFLPRGTRVQYYFKAVDINGTVAYGFSTDARAREVEDLPTLPGSTNSAPDIIEFDVLPGSYPVGAAGTLLAGRKDTPVLNLDGAYTCWSVGQDPVTQALRGMGVRADRYRPLSALDEGHHIGGHELTGDDVLRSSNYFPNMEEYGILDSLRSWYRILIESSHTATYPVLDESDAQLVLSWAATPTNSNDGDRCILFSGDDAFNSLINALPGVQAVRTFNLAANIFGIDNVTTLAPSAAKGSWAGNSLIQYPAIDDRFAAQASGPDLAPAGSFTYEVDGGCPGPNHFDPLSPILPGFAATYPTVNGVTDCAAVAIAREFDTPADLDQVKALAYGFSIQFVRGSPGAIPRGASSYVRSGVQSRMQILYKFLTGCRDARSAGSLCWPCPTDPAMVSNWATATGFNTGTYGPLMPIQDFTKATGLEVEEAHAAPAVNRIVGNSPNPFNPMTKISFSVAKAGKVSIRIFNVAGGLVRTLETKVQSAGPTNIYWDGKSDRNVGVASGVYFYMITFADGTTLAAGKKMVLVK
jgi:hypothetical protein